MSYAGDYYQGGGYNQGSPSPPPLQPPWVARWHNEAGRWIFVNEQTGATTFDHPGGYYQGGPPQGYGGGGGGGYGGGYGGEYVEDRSSSSGGNGLMYGALGAAAGVAGGALLMYEGEKIGKFFFLSMVIFCSCTECCGHTNIEY